MIDDFAELVATGNAIERSACAEASQKTQQFLDAVWAAANVIPRRRLALTLVRVKSR